MLGVYLPIIQHILGVTMFIRLAWCVGVAGVGQTFRMLAICCICVSFLHSWGFKIRVITALEF